MTRPARDVERIDRAARMADFERRLVALERRDAHRHGPRDGADVHLVATITLRIGGASWTCAELLEIARTDVDLGRALAEADITNAIELGLLLRRCAGLVIDGRIVHRAGVRRGCMRWRVEVVEV